MKLRRLIKLIAITGGLALAFYGGALLLGLSEVTIGKFSTDARDTNTALLLMLIGVVLTLYGWFDTVTPSRDNSDGSPQ
jgi:hypothetical protein